MVFIATVPFPVKEQYLKKKFTQPENKEAHKIWGRKEYFSGSSFAAITQVFGLFIRLQTRGSKNGKAIDLDIAPGMLQA